MENHIKPNILFVDNERFLTQRYVDALDEEYAVTFCQQLVDAEGHLKSCRDWACIIVDVMMPAPEEWASASQGGLITGLVLIERCRGVLSERLIPVVALSNMESEKVRGYVKQLALTDHVHEICDKGLRPFLLRLLVKKLIAGRSEAA